MTGKDLIGILSQGGTALASTKVRSQDIRTHCNVIETASSTQQEWEESVPGRKSWTLTVNYLMLAATQVRNLLYVGQTFDITVRDANNTSGGSVTGKAIVTDVSGVATVGNLAQGSFSFKGNGALT